MRRYYMAKNFTILYRQSVQRRDAEVQRSAGMNATTHCRACGDALRRTAAPLCHRPAVTPHDMPPAVLPPSMPRAAHTTALHRLRRCTPPRALHTPLPPCRTTAARRAVPPSHGAHSAPPLRAIRIAAACCAAPPLAPRRTPPAPRRHRPPYRPHCASARRRARHATHRAHHAPRRSAPSGTTARRPARIRAPTFSTARRNALPK